MMPLLIVLVMLGLGLGLLVSWRRAQRRAAELQESGARLEEALRVAQVGNWEWNLETNANIWSAETYRWIEERALV
jgi:type II secretory pathway pseudopilin PulG